MKAPQPGGAARGTLHAAASFAHPAMPQIVVNGTPRPPPRPATLAALVRDLGLEGKRIAVEVNGAVVPRSRHAQTPLADGDRVEIVGAVGGG